MMERRLAVKPMAERLRTKVKCRVCGRYGTHGFVPDPRGGHGMVCRAATACYRRWRDNGARGMWPRGVTQTDRLADGNGANP